MAGMLAGTLALGAMVLPAHGQDAQASGPAIFTRCAACHTPSGAGVPGTFPPLGTDVRMLAANPAGRRYLALVVAKGLMGAITVEGKAYRNVMPAQGLDDAGIAAVLNHVGTAIARQGPSFTPFTASEVATLRASGADLGPGQIAALHAAAGGQ